MRTPKFTDLHKYPISGYMSAAATDISRVFARERKRLAEVDKKQAEVKQEHKIITLHAKGG